MRICELSRELESSWDNYVIKHPESTFYHQIGWMKVVQKTYNHIPIYLCAIEKNRIIGVLPLFILRSIFFGKRIISIPFGSYGGICADNDEIVRLLLSKAQEITTKEKLSYLEIRNKSIRLDNLITNNVYSTLILELNPNKEIVWENKLKSQVRNKIRLSKKNLLDFEMSHDYLKKFYDLYAKSMKHLGTPVHNYRFFENLLSVFPKDSNIFIVKKDNIVISAMIVLFYKDHIISAWQAVDRNYLDYKPNNFLYWEAIKYGCINGFNFFDFGRSINNSGTFTFKESWGAEVKQLFYQYYLCDINKMPDTSQGNQKRSIFAKYWKDTPLFITNYFGPFLRKNLP